MRRFWLAALCAVATAALADTTTSGGYVLRGPFVKGKDCPTWATNPYSCWLFSDGNAHTNVLLNHDSRIVSAESTIAGHTATIAGQTSTLASHTSTLSSHTSSLSSQATSIASLNTLTSTQGATIAGHTSSLASQGATLATHDTSITALNTLTSAQGATITSHTSTLNTLTQATVPDLQSRVAALEAALAVTPQSCVAPVFTPASGSYAAAQSVAIATATSGATICYTTDGSTPDATSPGTCSTGSTYSAPVSVSADATLRAIATKATLNNSSVASAAYIIAPAPSTVATPAFSPSGGSYSGTQSVTVTTATSGATLYVDGSNPPTSTYTGPISVPSTTTLYAQAKKSGMTDSAIASSTYTITTGTQTKAAACAAEPLPQSPKKVFYVCDCDSGTTPAASTFNGNTDYSKSPLCVAGSDSNTGLSPSAPLRSIDVAFAREWAMDANTNGGVGPGDAIALCRGGRFVMGAENATISGVTAMSNQMSNFKNSRCTTESPCLWRDYSPPWGNGTERKPVVVSGDVGAGNVSTFRVFGQGTAYHGIRIMNIAFVHPLDGVGNAAGKTAFDHDGWIDNVEYCNNDIVGFDGAMVYGATGDMTYSGRAYSGYCGEHMNVRGNRFFHNCTDALLFQGADSDIDGNLFDWNGHDACTGYSHWGSSGPGAHTLYIGTSCVSPRNNVIADNIRVINNEIHHAVTCDNAAGCGSANWAYGSCASINAAGVGGQSTNTLFENNWFDLPTVTGSLCSAIGGGNFSAEYQLSGPRNWTIRRNRISMAAGNRAIGFSAGLNALVEDNLIETHGPFGGWGTGPIAIPHDSYSNVYALAGVLNDMTANVTIRNNTVIVNGANNASDVFDQIIALGAYNPTQLDTNGVAGTGFVVTGNVIYLRNDSHAGTCFSSYDKTNIAYMDRNACVTDSTSTVQSWWGPTQDISGAGVGPARSRAEWNTYSGFDANSIYATGVASSTLFVNGVDGVAHDFTPAAGASIIGTATQTSSCKVLVCSGTGDSRTCALSASADQPCMSSVAIEAPTWSPTTNAKSRDATPDLGAFER